MREKENASYPCTGVALKIAVSCPLTSFFISLMWTQAPVSPLRGDSQNIFDKSALNWNRL